MRRASILRRLGSIQDFEEDTILEHPQQYQVGPRSEDLNERKVDASPKLGPKLGSRAKVLTIGVAVLHAFVFLGDVDVTQWM